MAAYDMGAMHVDWGAWAEPFGSVDAVDGVHVDGVVSEEGKCWGCLVALQHHREIAAIKTTRRNSWKKE